MRKEFGLGFNVWIQPVSSPYKEKLSQLNYSSSWSVPSRASKGDLIFYYHTHSPDKCVKEAFLLTSAVKHQKAYWKPGMDYMGSIRLVCRLKAPLFFEDFQRDHFLGTAGFVRGQMQGRPNVTEYWPYLYDRILRRNPSIRRPLERYAPDALAPVGSRRVPP